MRHIGAFHRVIDFPDGTRRRVPLDIASRSGRRARRQGAVRRPDRRAVVDGLRPSDPAWRPATMIDVMQDDLSRDAAVMARPAAPWPFRWRFDARAAGGALVVFVLLVGIATVVRGSQSRVMPRPVRHRSTTRLILTGYTDSSGRTMAMYPVCMLVKLIFLQVAHLTRGHYAIFSGDYRKSIRTV